MRKVRKGKRYNRHGASSVFLAIILSALILVECIYLAIVVDADRRLAYRRAMKLEVDTVLADYDRDLFRNYGIYAFDVNGVDNDVFKRSLLTQGIVNNDPVSIEATDCFTPGVLRNAISVFYTYRATGITFDGLAEVLTGMCDDASVDDLTEAVREFTSSKAAKYFRKLLKGGKTVSSVLGSIGKLFNIDSLSEKMDHYKDLINSINSMMDEAPDYTGNFNIGNLSGFTDIVQGMCDLNGSISAFTEEHLFRTASSHYGAYNFDTVLEDDTLINGTAFDDIHEGNNADAEYILTGSMGDRGADKTKLMIFPVVYLIDLADLLRDSQKMSIIEGISDVLSAAISLLSAGTVSLPPQVYKAVITVIYAGICAWHDMDALLDGDKIDVFDIGEQFTFSLGYQDFIFIYLHFVSTDKVLDRMADVLERDYEGYCSSVLITATCGNTDYSQYATYQLYD